MLAMRSVLPTGQTDSSSVLYNQNTPHHHQKRLTVTRLAHISSFYLQEGTGMEFLFLSWLGHASLREGFT